MVRGGRRGIAGPTIVFCRSVCYDLQNFKAALATRHTIMGSQTAVQQSVITELGEERVKRRQNGDMNKLAAEDRPAHDWYRFVLSFPPHLVREYISKFKLGPTHRVLDPFCGTGTTVVECKKHGIASVGVEAHPMTSFATRVKSDWTPDPEKLVAHAEAVANATRAELASGLFANGRTRKASLRKLSDEAEGLLLANSISPVPLHKTLVLLESLEKHYDARYIRHEKIALAKALTGPIGNLHFGPEVGVGPAKDDAPVVDLWLAQVVSVATDLHRLKSVPAAVVDVHCADSRRIRTFIEPASIDAVITSPPYPNEKDYTRTTRLESVILGFLHNKKDLRGLKQDLMRSNTRNVYKGDDDDNWVAEHAEIQRIAETIEAKRKQLNKTSGFERLYAKVTKLYFGGMARHLDDLRLILRPGAQLAYVVGDQASYLRIMIRTGELLADIAQSLGYEKVGIDLFRTRLATATKEQLREEVVLLRWPG